MLAFPESCGITSKTLINIMSLFHIHYTITPTDKLLQSNSTKSEIFYFNGKMRLIMKMRIHWLKMNSLRVYFHKLPEHLLSMLLNELCLYMFFLLIYLKTENVILGQVFRKQVAVLNFFPVIEKLFSLGRCN